MSKNVFAPASVRRAKYEGKRTLIEIIEESWDLAQAECATTLDRYWDLMRGHHLEGSVLWILGAPARELNNYREVDSEDQCIGAAQYIYECYLLWSMGKTMAEGPWRAVWPHWDAHFWRTLGAYRGSTPESARKALELKLIHSSLGLTEFVSLIK